MRRVLLLLALLMFVGGASATDYYVNNSWAGASDSNLGLANTNDNAWKTIQYAIENVSSGDTIYVYGGTDYTERLIINETGSVDNINLIGVNNPAVVFSRNGGTLVIGINNVAGDLMGITVYGFNITNSYDNSYYANGISILRDSNASYLNISNNEIHTEYGYGISFSSGAGNNSIIQNNEVYTGFADGIIIQSETGHNPTTNLTIYNNSIWACLDWVPGTYSSGIRTGTFAAINTFFNVSYNKIVQSGYTGIKPNGVSFSVFDNNIIYADGYAHNAYENLFKDTIFSNNKVFGRNASWQGGTGCSGNLFYAAGASYQYNFTVKNWYSNDTGWCGIHVGGHQENVLIENVTMINHNGDGVVVFGWEGDGVPLKKFTSNNIIMRNLSVGMNTATLRAMKIVGLGTNTTTDHTDSSAYIRDMVTFIDIAVTGTYTSYTWWLTNAISGAANGHFNGSVFVINANKHDVQMDPGREPYNGTVDFMYYSDILVVDTSDNPISGATVMLTSNQTNGETGEVILAKNINYSSAVKGHVDDIVSVTTKSNGHTAKPDEDMANTIALTATTEDRYTKKGVQWSTNVTKTGYNYNNTVVIIPDSTWYRDILDVNVYQNTTKIILSGGTPWSPSNTSIYSNTTAPIEITTKTDGKNIFSRVPTQNDNYVSSSNLVVITS